MKHEAWIFAIATVFFLIVSPAYWLIAGDWTGTSALVMTTLLMAMVTVYLGYHASRMQPRPEDLKDAEIADGAGELGFFSPGSYWPFGLALSAGLMGLALAFYYPWLIAIAGAALLLTIGGLLFEYYVGQNAH
jgi:hypothetical protein